MLGVSQQAVHGDDEVIADVTHTADVACPQAEDAAGDGGIEAAVGGERKGEGSVLCIHCRQPLHCVGHWQGAEQEQTEKYLVYAYLEEEEEGGSIYYNRPCGCTMSRASLHSDIISSRPSLNSACFLGIDLNSSLSEPPPPPPSPPLLLSLSAQDRPASLHNTSRDD